MFPYLATRRRCWSLSVSTKSLFLEMFPRSQILVYFLILILWYKPNFKKKKFWSFPETQKFLPCFRKKNPPLHFGRQKRVEKIELQQFHIAHWIGLCKTYLVWKFQVSSFKNGQVTASNVAEPPNGLGIGAIISKNGGGLGGGSGVQIDGHAQGNPTVFSVSL